MDKLAYKYQEYRRGAELEASPSNEAAQGVLDQMKAAARSVGIMGPETPSVMAPSGDLGKMPAPPADAPVVDTIRASTPQETQKAKAAPTAKEVYDPSQTGLVGSSLEAGKSQGAQAVAGTYSGLADFYGTLDGLAAIVSRKAGMGKPEVFAQLKGASEYWAEHYQSKVSIDDYMTRIVGGVLGSGPALVEFAMGPEWAALKGFAQDGQIADALYSAARRVGAGAVFGSAHRLDAAARVGTGTAYMTGESMADQYGQTGKIDVGQTAEAAGVGLGMMLSGGLGPGNKSGQIQRQSSRSWVETSQQGDTIFKDFEAGKIDSLTKDMALDFFASDKAALGDTSLAVVDKVQLIRKGVDDWILRTQGVDPAKVAPEDWAVTGKTRTEIEGDTYRTAIELYQGHNAETLAEEWYHRNFDRLSAKELRPVNKAYDAYLAALEPDAQPMIIAEFYAKGATDKLFAERIAKGKGVALSGFEKAVDAARTSFTGLVDTVKAIPGAKVGVDATPERNGPDRTFQVRKVEDILYDPTPAPLAVQKMSDDGRFNLSHFNNDADLLKVLNDTARAMSGTPEMADQTRGVRPNAQVEAEASTPAMLDIEKQLATRPGTVATDVEMKASGFILEQLAAQAVPLLRVARSADATPADVESARKAILLMSRAMSVDIGLGAESARSLAARRQRTATPEAQTFLDATNAAVRKWGNERNVDAITDGILGMIGEDGKLDGKKLARFMASVDKASTFDMILEARYMAMLANPATHLKNMLGNSIALGSQILERGVAEGIGAVRDLFSKNAIDRVEAGETAAMMYGGIEGLRAGAQAFLKAVRTGESTDPMGKLETVRRAITAENLGVDPKDPWGKMIDFTAERLRTGNMMLGAEDDFFKAIGYSMELNARAHRAATSEGLKGQEFADRVQDLVANPPWQMQMQAMDFAHYSTFTNALGEGMTKLQGALGADYTVTLKSGKTYEVPTGKLFRLAVPFFRTPANIVSYGMKRSPFAVFMPSVQQDLITGGAARDMALARITLGSTLGFMAAQAAASGLITGGGPSDPKQKENLREVGWQPYSVKVGDKWISYQSLEPFSMIIGAAADIALFDDYLEENERNNAAMMVAGAFSQAVTSKTFMQGMAGMIDVLQDPDRYGDKYAQQFAASFIPSPVKALRRDVDPIVREIWTVSDALNNSLPWKSGDLYPRRNRYGDPITTGDVWLSNLVDPMRKTNIKNEENSSTYAVDKVIQENNISIPRAQKTIHWQGVGVALTPEEYDRYQQIPQEVGMLDHLQRVVASPEFERATGGPDGLKAHMVKEVFLDARERARYEIVKESQGIPGGLAERIELERLDRQMKQEATK